MNVSDYWASLVAQTVKNLSAVQETGSQVALVVWSPPANAGDIRGMGEGGRGSIPGLGRFPRGGHGNPH